jgi:hypothetical protein
MTRCASKPNMTASLATRIQFLIIFSPQNLGSGHGGLKGNNCGELCLFLRHFVQCNISVEILCIAAYMHIHMQPIPPRRELH